MSIMQELEEAMKAREAAAQRVDELRSRAKEEGLEQIRTIVRDLGLTAEDLIKLAPRAAPAKTRNARKASAFWWINLADETQIWKGVGPKPTWLKELSPEEQEACKVAARS
uniref:Putative Histone-like nucleoid-structuring protein H-NS n=1 Tax=mine drainage metagenome TaxID=410659 RepID=E6QC80_9ZZZZ